jgi:hypothetical protein
MSELWLPGHTFLQTLGLQSVLDPGFELRTLVDDIGEDLLKFVVV